MWGAVGATGRDSASIRRRRAGSFRESTVRAHCPWPPYSPPAIASCSNASVMSYSGWLRSVGGCSEPGCRACSLSSAGRDDEQAVPGGVHLGVRVGPLASRRRIIFTSALSHGEVDRELVPALRVHERGVLGEIGAHAFDVACRRRLHERPGVAAVQRLDIVPVARGLRGVRRVSLRRIVGRVLHELVLVPAAVVEVRALAVWVRVDRDAVAVSRAP